MIMANTPSANEANRSLVMLGFLKLRLAPQCAGIVGFSQVVPSA
jgi:hypothetical protein